MEEQAKIIIKNRIYNMIFTIIIAGIAFTTMIALQIMMPEATKMGIIVLIITNLLLLITIIYYIKQVQKCYQDLNAIQLITTNGEIAYLKGTTLLLKNDQEVKDFYLPRKLKQTVRNKGKNGIISIGYTPQSKTVVEMR